MFKDLDAYIKDQERIAKIDKHMTEIESKYSFLNPEMESIINPMLLKIW